MEVLCKDTIENIIVPHLSTGKRGTRLRVPPWQLMSLILLRVKMNCTWRMLPVHQFVPHEIKLSWKTVYYHFSKWLEDGSLRKAWIALLNNYRHCLDMSSIQLDGTHTPVLYGGEQVAYQPRKGAKTTNMLFICDNNGVPLAMGAPQSGNHHDLHDIEAVLEQMCTMIKEAGISLEGVFMNADSGFDAAEVAELCAAEGMIANIDENKRNRQQLSERYRYFDELLYKRRFVIERMNAHMDTYRAVRWRDERKVKKWIGIILICFIVIASKKFNC